MAEPTAIGPSLSYAAVAQELLAHRLAQPDLSAPGDTQAALRTAFDDLAKVFALEQAATAGQKPGDLLTTLLGGLRAATRAVAARVILKSAIGTLVPLERALEAPDDTAIQVPGITSQVVGEGLARASDIADTAAAIDLPDGVVAASLACAALIRQDGEVLGAVQLFGAQSAAFGANDLELATRVGAFLAELAVNAGLVPWHAQGARLVPRAPAETVDGSAPAGHAILSRLLSVALEILDADTGWVLLYEPASNELFTALAEGLGDRDLRVSAQDGIAGATFRTGELLNIPNAYQDPRFNPAVDAMIDFRTRSILCVPIVSSDGQRLGVLQLLNKRRGTFNTLDEEHLKSLASQMGVTRDYTTLFAEVLRMKSHNESMLRSLTNGVLTVDTGGEITFVNQAALDTLRRSEIDMIGLPLSNVLGEMNGWILEAVAEIENGGGEKHLPNSEIYIEGEDDWISVNVVILPLLDTAQRPIGCMLVIESLERERELRRAMSRYVSNEVIDQLIEDSGASLGGTAQTVTTLFADIRSFTSLSESLGAAGTVSMLNEYFSYMEDVLTNHAGIIDKYIGDAVMATFGMPFPNDADAQNSVLAACDMVKVLELLNMRRTAAGGSPLRIGVGIATGTVIAGNIGSPKRMDFTVIGDPVNLASRIESMTKLYGADILICEQTRKRLTTTPKMRRIDVVRVRGQTRPTNLYEVLEHRAPQWTPAFDEANVAYEAGLDAYIAGDWTAALGNFEAALKLRGDDKAAHMMVERCQRYRVSPPESWDGVTS